MDKIKVNLGNYTFSVLEHDMEEFCFLKKNGETNTNLFLNTLVANAYEERFEKISYIRNNVNDMLQSYHIPTEDMNKVIDFVDEYANKGLVDRIKIRHQDYVSFRPNKEFQDIFDTIEEEHLQNDTMSNFMRCLFNDYAKLPQYMRESIIFQKEINIVNRAIKNHRMVRIKDLNITFCPYTFMVNQEETFIYMIGYNVKVRLNKEASPIHLFKLRDNVSITSEFYEFDEEEEKKLEKILDEDPKFSAFRNYQAKVRLTKEGKKLFKKIYTNRPRPTKIEGDDYYFECSANNLVIYFQRFGEEAYVIYPQFVSKQLRDKFKNAYEAYNSNLKFKN